MPLASANFEKLSHRNNPSTERSAQKRTGESPDRLEGLIIALYARAVGAEPKAAVSSKYSQDYEAYVAAQGGRE